MQVSRVNQLDPTELAAWRGFLRAHAALVRDLDRELELAHGLPLSHYEVLLVLSNAPGSQLRMSELADSVLLSQSGLTRLVDRLAREGLVSRERCEQDRRGTFAQLTDRGRARLEEARQTHLAGVRARFVDRFDETELGRLAAAWERLNPGGEAGGPDCT